MSAADSEWTYVSTAKKASKQRQRRRTTAASHKPADLSSLAHSIQQSNQHYDSLSAAEQHVKVQAIAATIRRKQQELLASDWWQTFAAYLPQAEATDELQPARHDFVCLGIGHIASHRSSQYQLACFLAVIERLGSQHTGQPSSGADEAPASHCSIYDPILTHLEQDVARHVGLTVSADNTAGAYIAAAERNTICYLPHCPAGMYNNLLRANLRSVDDICVLHRMTIIGNSLITYAERVIHSRSQQSTAAIKILHGHRCINEQAAADTFTIPNVFNDTSVHTFPHSDASECLLCTLAVQPVTQSSASDATTKVDSELITDALQKLLITTD